MNKSFTPYIASVSIFLSALAYAEPETYLGAGYVTTDFQSDFSNPTAFRLQMGYIAENNFGVEFSYIGASQSKKVSSGTSYYSDGNRTYNNFLGHKINGEELFATYTLGNEFYCRGKLGYARIKHQYEYISSDPESASIATMRLSGKTISIGGGKRRAETSVQGAAAAVSAGYIYKQFIFELSLTRYDNNIDSNFTSASILYHFN
jgi:hypothetical protein